MTLDELHKEYGRLTMEAKIAQARLVNIEQQLLDIYNHKPSEETPDESTN